MTATTTDYPLALELIRTALSDPSLALSDIPADATFDVRRDVEYYAEQECHPNYAAPYGPDPLPGVVEQGSGWERSGDEETIESDWCGDEVMVRAYRWDLYGVTIDQLEWLALHNGWEGAEPMLGYLDSDGMRPSCSVMSDGMDWNRGGWTPVFIAADYVVLV
ncbi:MAG: hypothetical protein GY773_00925 [Actinomycetia bacterium]|nr:hypothetical protein [Actinomycetes bacterium]